ncbi:MAG: aldo/keto reductase [Asgard group archaeon]|nr:aldo/keto reductase [Asgard group archaeon]
MKYRNLGKHGLKLSEISIGTMHHGSYLSKEKSHKVLAEAINQGINFIDCANRYGIYDASNLPVEERTRAEIVLGEFIQDYDRADLVISSKVFYQMRDTPNSGGLSRKHIREEIRDTLKYLQTDYLDLYFCHRPHRETPLKETILTISNLIDEGYVNYWGTSWWPPVLVERTIALAKELGAHPPAAEQPPYSMRGRFIEVDLLELAKYHGLGLTTFEALASGFLTGKYLEGVPKGSRMEIQNFDREDIYAVYKKICGPLMEIAEELEISLNHLAIAWALRHPEVTTTIMGATKPKQVISNVEASGIELKEDTLERIEEILDNKPKTNFR